MIWSMSWFIHVGFLSQIFVDLICWVKLWNDTELVFDVGWLVKQLFDGRVGWVVVCGLVLVVVFIVIKFLWLYCLEFEYWVCFVYVLLLYDWLMYWFMGELVIDWGDVLGIGYWFVVMGEYWWDLFVFVDRERDWLIVVPRVFGLLDEVGWWG